MSNARLLSFAVPLIPLISFAQPAPLTSDEVVREALRSSPQVAAARARVEAAHDTARAQRGRMLVGVRLSDEQQHYRAPFSLPFPSPPPLPPQQVLVRAINTNSFVLSADQPLLGLLHLDRDYAALQSTADAAQESQRAVEAAVREDALIQLLTLFESRALGETARASERQLGDQLAVMESKLQAGVATQADVLRLKVALANARQQEIQARAQEQVARANLLSALGRDPADRSTQFAEPMELLDLAEPIPTLVSAVERGLDRRPELASAQLQTQAARQRSQGRLFQLLPEVDLEAAYIHVQGQVFFPLNSTFVGVKADWPIFQWGARLYDQRAADRQAAAAASDQEATRRRIGTEVSARLSQLEAASFAVEVAQTTIASAEEAYRVTQALAQAGSATTTDLLDAQAALTQARLNLVRARYQMAIARVALARATGF